VEKAYNAEKAGAKAILVMDDREEQLLTMAAPEDHPEIAKLREDITIPTALIRRVNFTTPTPPPSPSYPPQASCHKNSLQKCMWLFLLYVGQVFGFLEGEGGG